MLNFALGALIIVLTCTFVCSAFVAGVVVVGKMVAEGTKKQTDILLEGMNGVTTMLRDTVISTVTTTTTGVLNSMVGETGKAVPQADVPPEGDLLNPAWTAWNDGEEDAMGNGGIPTIGDSVFFERPTNGDMRVAGIEEGESIIPGVPVPDMSGEEWNG